MLLLPHGFAAFARDDRKQNSANLFQAIQSIANHFVAEYWSRAFVPAHAFPRFREGVFKSQRPILSGTSRVSFADICINTHDRSIKLRRDFLSDEFGSE